ncbi:MAG TPA: class I adenylate-forming enzyme family protein, partial [Acidimicrobiales bacterium]|nr:class I adenylate-forming enzyme family protein [Acidimicrobiales bacterium]
MRNLPEWVVAFTAALSVGAVSVSFNAWWTEEEIDYAVGDAGLSVLVCDPERMARAHGPCERRGVPVLVTRSDTLVPVPPGVDRWKEVVVRGPAMPDVEIDPESDATILYTSGTTGFPKGAVSTHRAICQALMAFGCNGALQGVVRGPAPKPAAPTGSNPPCFILIVPLFHVTGCVPVMLSCFSVQLKLVMLHRWDPEKALELIERHKVTVFVGVPTQSWDLLESPRFHEFDTSSLVSVGGGGAPAPPKLVQRIEGSFSKGRPGIGYGMTETNAFGPGNSGDDYVQRPTSTGRARTSILDVEIRDDDLRVVPTGERGEIWMKGPNLFRGYWGKPEATAEVLVDGWLRSGDIGRVDAEGFLYVEDRAKDMVLRAGENVYSAEVEAAIYEHPAVHEAAVFGVPHERLGEEVACVVCLKAGATLTDDELRDFLATHLAAFKIPTRVALVHDLLPRNPAGKFLKRELRTSYFADAAPSTLAT